MNCNICKRTETKDESLANCDNCNNKLCQTCSKLSTTEYRAVTMKSSRALLYWCINCKANKAIITNQDLKQLITDIVRKEITTALKNVEMFKSEPTVIAKLDLLSTDICNLKDSNIELIKLLTDGDLISKSLGSTSFGDSDIYTSKVKILAAQNESLLNAILDKNTIINDKQKLTEMLEENVNQTRQNV